MTTPAIPSAAGLRKIREDLGLSQAEFASALGFGRNGARTIWQWENDDGYKPTGLAWAAIRYLAGLEKLYRLVDGTQREEIRQIFPECLR